ncbi:MAG: serine/threonine-protein kinase [Acidobacteriota bacterium]|nr:MAG: serine/threonine-protein kinase [Acidobacteriota bacterium]
MGEVFLAEDPRLGRKVALKRVSDARRATPEAREQLRREAKAAAQLIHPNIAVIYDVIESGDQPYIVMEYIEGQTLHERRLQGPMSAQEVIEIGRQISSALTEAHRLGIVHRDLKPANILITPSGTVKILDFGLARIEHANESENTTAGQVVGTPAYMPPEQMLGYRADHRSDIFAVGVVLFELATGKWPLEKRAAQALVLDDLRARIPKASDLNPGIPGPLSEIIAKAMSWEPSERQQSAAELHRELVSLAGDPTPTSSGFEPVAGNTPRPGAARTLAFVVALVLMLGLIVAGIVLNQSRAPADAPPVVAVVPLVNVSGDESIDHIGVGIAHTLVTKLSAIPSVTTISSGTRLEYGADSLDTKALARDLGATFVVNGSVQRMRDLLHITVNLVRADDSVAWGSEFEGSLDDLFDLQRRLAAGVSEALHLNLTPQQKRRLEEPLTSNVNAYAEYSQGRYFLERTQNPDDLARAIRLLESAVDKDPGFAQAYAALGEAYWERFEKTTDREWTERAREAAEAARALDPDHPSVHYVLAVIDNGTGQTDEALGELRRALALQPNHDEAYRLLGEIFAVRGDIEAAAREIKRAIAIRPNFWGHYRALGLAYFRAGRFAEATEMFRRVTELQPDLAIGFQSLGTTYHVMGDLDNAIRNYEISIELKPNAPSLNNLGTVYYRKQQFADAARSYERALEIQPNRAVTHRNLGDAYRRLGETEKAEAAYQRSAALHRNVLEVNPRDARTLGLLALMEAKLGRVDDATRHVAEALALAPSDAQVLYHSAVVQVFAGHRGEAMASLHLAVEQGYGINELREDDDLDSLHDLPEFRALFAEGDERESLP